MKDIYIWGSGAVANEILGALQETVPDFRSNEIFKIKGVIDNNPQKYNSTFYGLPVVSPETALTGVFSDIVILCDAEPDIRKQLVYGYGLQNEIIHIKWFLLKLVMELKFKDTSDMEIRSTLEYWKENPMSLYNNYLLFKDSYSEVIWDRKLNLPYIEFPTIENKLRRMYYPRNHRFEIVNNKQVIKNILYEQAEDSPHLYVTGSHNIKDGDIILDGGVCEGNFALRYADVASKIFLVENDAKWAEPLYYTFQDYSDKVVFCNKKLSNRDGYHSVSIDVLVSGKLDFMKLDIEGEEVSAIMGAEQTLKKNNVKCSVCAYHKQEDEFRLKKLFADYGYESSVSKGYMVFLWDKDIFYNADFRRGMVYARKN